MSKSIDRRDFVKNTGVVTAATVFAPAIVTAQTAPKRYAIVGTGHRGTGMCGKDLIETYSNEVRFVGLCDKNIKRRQRSVHLFVHSAKRETDL